VLRHPQGRQSLDDRNHLLGITGPSDMFGELSVFDSRSAHHQRDCCPALKMTMTPSLSMKTKMVALVATLTG
jgi:hypothetical protein